MNTKEKYPTWELKIFIYSEHFQKFEISHKGKIRPKEDMDKIIKELKPQKIDISFASGYWTLELKLGG